MAWTEQRGIARWAIGALFAYLACGGNGSGTSDSAYQADDGNRRDALADIVGIDALTSDVWSADVPGSDNVTLPPVPLCLDVKPLRIGPPAGLQVRFRLLDCEGNAIRPLVSGDVTVLNDEKGTPFGVGGEGGSASDIGENSSIELYSVVVLDMSDSIYKAGALDAVIDGAKQFVQEAVAKPTALLKHRVALIAFGAPLQITLEQGFTQDDKVLDAKLEELRGAPSRGTTDLYDAYMLALRTVASVGSTEDTVLERFVVLLTDGTHEAGNETSLRQQALVLKHQTEATIYTIGMQGNYNACRLEELAGRGGPFATSTCREEDGCMDTAPPASCTQFYPGVDQAAISEAFQVVADRVQGLARSNYSVGICTPVTLGNPSLTMKIEVDGLKVQETMAYSVKQLTGDLNGCDANAIQTACAGKICDSDQGVVCGTCGQGKLCRESLWCEDVCVGMTCGSDKGVSCGECVGGAECTMGVCSATCREMWACIIACGNDIECGAGCSDRGASEPLSRFNALGRCYFTSCFNAQDIDECASQTCPTEYEACMECLGC